MSPDTNHTPLVLSPDANLWIFGYGSLTWKPDFAFSSRRYGHITGYARRFWQGNVTHRGVPGAPGRVATLVKSDKEECWGTAFEVRGEEQIIDALQKLNIREGVLGGYEARLVDFHPKDQSPPVQVLLFIAAPDNAHYLGPAEMSTIAREIASAGGASGPNCEYVFKLAEYMRVTFPDVRDDHLFELEMLVLDILQLNCFGCQDARTIVNGCRYCYHYHKIPSHESRPEDRNQTIAANKVITY